ncbi:MAG: carbamate kinase [bacterium]
MKSKTAIIALGGNAITQPGVPDTIANQFRHTRQSLGGIVALAREGFGLVVTHGNGPQVGNALLRIELTRDKAPVLPLGICVADTEGGMGYMIEQSLQNRLRAEGINREVVTLITQMLVRADDPAITNPTKYIGQFYDEATARKLAREEGWQVKPDTHRGWRRVVASPIPYHTVAAKTIKSLVAAGTIVIAGGGGGIPVYIDENGNYEGVDAVIDKDFASAVIAHEIGAGILSILTSVERVSINFGKPDQEDLDTVTLTQIKQYRDEGHFPPGSMGPKIDAAIKFMEAGGELVTITSLDHARDSVHGEAGTRIVPD